MADIDPINALKKLLEIEPNNSFYQSLQKQADETGGLTERQAECVLKDFREKVGDYHVEVTIPATPTSPEAPDMSPKLEIGAIFEHNATHLEQLRHELRAQGYPYLVRNTDAKMSWVHFWHTPTQASGYMARNYPEVRYVIARNTWSESTNCFVFARDICDPEKANLPEEPIVPNTTQSTNHTTNAKNTDQLSVSAMEKTLLKAQHGKDWYLFIEPPPNVQSQRPQQMGLETPASTPQPEPTTNAPNITCQPPAKPTQATPKQAHKKVSIDPDIPKDHYLFDIRSGLWDGKQEKLRASIRILKDKGLSDSDIVQQLELAKERALTTFKDDRMNGMNGYEWYRTCYLSDQLQKHKNGLGFQIDDIGQHHIWNALRTFEGGLALFCKALGEEPPEIPRWLEELKQYITVEVATCKNCQDTLPDYVTQGELCPDCHLKLNVNIEYLVNSAIGDGASTAETPPAPTLDTKNSQPANQPRPKPEDSDTPAADYPPHWTVPTGLHKSDGLSCTDCASVNDDGCGELMPADLPKDNTINESQMSLDEQPTSQQPTSDDPFKDTRDRSIEQLKQDLQVWPRGWLIDTMLADGKIAQPEAEKIREHNQRNN